MQLTTSFLSLVVASTLAVAAVAQPPEIPLPQPEHHWLKQFVGTWTTTSKTAEVDGQPTVECTGSMKSRMLGAYWVVNEMEGNVDGVTFNALQTIGYDAEKKKYVGTWIDSMMNHLWKYEGSVDKSGKRLVLIAEGPNFLGGGGTAKYRDSYEFTAPDRVIVSSEMQTDEDQWVTFMTGEMTRTD